MKKYFLFPLSPHIYFSPREAQCIAYFLQGYSNAEVATFLNISRNTVNSYLINMEIKLGCKSKISLIAKVCQTEFMNYLPELLIPNF